MMTVKKLSDPGGVRIHVKILQISPYRILEGTNVSIPRISVLIAELRKVIR